MTKAPETTESAPALPDITGLLLAWYDACRRILPWRENPTPYHVWVSEIMLQQTRVEAVIPYYERFLAELPDVAALAAAPEDRLLKLWEGLGYYSRVRNLQKAARQVMERYGGTLPADPILLEKLAGIGPYTAAAIASIAYQVRVPSVDGNLLRVYARLSGYPEEIGTPAAKKAAFSAFLRVLPEDRPGDMNQALMDLGGTICLPNGAPACGRCPLADCCTAKREGLTAQLPVIGKKAPRKIEARTILILRTADGRVLLRKRPAKGLLAGLWEFPNAEGHLTPEEVRAWCRAQGLCARTVTPAPAARHIFTHLEWDMTGYEVLAEPAALSATGDCPGSVTEDCAYAASAGSIAESCACAALSGSAEEAPLPALADTDAVFLPARTILSDYALPAAFAAYTALLH